MRCCTSESGVICRWVCCPSVTTDNCINRNACTKPSPPARRWVPSHHTGRAGEGFACKAPKAALHQILVGVAQHRLLQRERLLRMIGDVDAPPQAAYGGTYRRLIDLTLQVPGALHPNLCRGAAIGAHCPLADLFLDLEPQQPLHLVVLANRLGRVLQRVSIA